MYTHPVLGLINDNMKYMSRAPDLNAMSNAELRELLAHHGFPNQPVTSTTRNVLISRLRKKLAEGTPKVRQTTNYLSRYSSAEEESDRETTNPRSKPATLSTMPPPPASSKRKRAPAQGSFSLFSPSTTSSTVGSSPPTSNTLPPTVKVPIQSRSSVYIPPPAVHSSDTEESDGGGATSRSAANPYLSYGRLSGLAFPKRYSPQLETAAPRTAHFGASSKNGPSIRQRATYNHGNTEALTRLSDTNNSSSGTEDSPYVSDFTKRLLQFRDRNLTQQQQDASARTDNRPVLPPNSRYVRTG